MKGRLDLDGQQWNYGFDVDDSVPTVRVACPSIPKQTKLDIDSVFEPKNGQETLKRLLDSKLISRQMVERSDQLQ